MCSCILAVTSPDCTAVLVGGMPHLASECAATFRTYKLSGKQAFAVSAVGILEFLLNDIILFLRYDCLMSISPVYCSLISKYHSQLKYTITLFLGRKLLNEKYSFLFAKSK